MIYLASGGLFALLELKPGFAKRLFVEKTLTWRGNTKPKSKLIMHQLFDCPMLRSSRQWADFGTSWSSVRDGVNGHLLSEEVT